MMEHKTVHAEIKQVGETGTFEAVIATLGVIDHDGDIIEPGAFGNQTVAVLPSHDWGSVPLGKAHIEERGNKAVAVGRFNLEIPAAKDWHSALMFDLANPPAVQEWSFGYEVKAGENDTVDGQMVRRLMKLDSSEVSPVLRGAGIATGTLAAKTAVGKHSTETSKAPWDGPKNERALPSPLTLAQVKSAYAWYDQSKAEDGKYPKSAARFIHHFVTDGKAGAASTRACVAGIAVLNGARGGTTIPDGDRKGVYSHLAGHLRDAGIEPPELRSRDEPGIKLVDQIVIAAWDCEAAAARIREVSDQRRKDGREVNEKTRAAAIEMAARYEDMHRLAKALQSLVEHCSPDDEMSRALSEWAQANARV